MRYWVQFLIPSATEPATLIDACGSDGVCILDGRNTSENMRRDALRQAQRLEHVRRFAAFRIVRGERFTEERARGPVHRLTYPIQTN